MQAKQSSFFFLNKDTDFNSLHQSTLNSSNIERVTEYKYLGIWLNDSFTPKHCESEYETASKSWVSVQKQILIPLFNCRKTTLYNMLAGVHHGTLQTHSANCFML